MQSSLNLQRAHASFSWTCHRLPIFRVAKHQQLYLVPRVAQGFSVSFLGGVELVSGFSSGMFWSAFALHCAVMDIAAHALRVYWSNRHVLGNIGGDKRYTRSDR